MQTGAERWVEDRERVIDLDEHYKPYPPQQRFHESKARFRGLGGAAGPGKSLAMIYDYVDFSYGFEVGTEVHCLMLRRTAPMLKKSLIERFREKVPSSLYRKFNESQGNYEVFFWNGANLVFGAMQHEKDVYNYQGSQWARIGYDESTQFTFKQWYEIQPWNRCPVAAPKQDGATNPIGIGVGWFMPMFGCDGKGKRPAPGMDDNQKRQYRPSDYEFIPCTFLDNPVYANDAVFMATLDALPERLRIALKLGLWDAALGSYFDIWDEAVHTVEPGEIKIEDWWPKWVSQDWGFGHKSAMYWHTLLPDGRVYTYREMVFAKRTPTWWGGEIVSRSFNPFTRSHEKIEYYILSFDAFSNRDGDETRTISEQIAAVLREANKTKAYPHMFPEPEQATREKAGSEMFLYDQMAGRQVLISTDCKELIAVIPAAPRDEEKVEEVAYFDGNDPLDGYRYGFTRIYRTKAAPLANRVQARLKGLIDMGKVSATDAFAIAMASRRIETQERRTGGPKVLSSHRIRPGIRRGQ